jgi:hypothetical protein
MGTYTSEGPQSCVWHCVYLCRDYKSWRGEGRGEQHASTSDSVPLLLLLLLSRNIVLTVPRPVFCGLFFPRHCVAFVSMATHKWLTQNRFCVTVCVPAAACTWYRTAQVVPQVREYMTAVEGGEGGCVCTTAVCFLGGWVGGGGHMWADNS